ncbi:hypothetical protein L1049_010374 [Liquidambar formosana]|uniref:GrpE protein homolog n=1 Tax=Liquidambar formosana TaxID=63359 RepID=A0AAP0N982_LIQFO
MTGAHQVHNTPIVQRFGISSFASPQPSEKESNQSGDDSGTSFGDNGTSINVDSTESSSDAAALMEYADLSIDDLVKLLAEKDNLLKLALKKLEEMREIYKSREAEWQELMERTRREAEKEKEYAIQDFAKSILDVADNLERACSVIEDRLKEIDGCKDTAGVVPLMQTLLEGVKMIDWDLEEVLSNWRIFKFDPLGEQFDPYKHHAVFEVYDDSKPPGTVAVVLKPGYEIRDRVLRPAEVGVVAAASNSNKADQALDSNKADQASGA